MSASRETNTRATDPHSKLGVKEARAKQKEAEERKKQTRNTVLGAIGTVVVLGLVLWNQGFMKTIPPAFTLNGVSYTTSQVEMYYTDSIYGAIMGEIEPGLGGDAYDMSIPADVQFYGSNPFKTWHEFFVDEAVMTLAEIHTVSEEAKKAGFVLPQEGLDQIESTKFALDTSWIGYYSNKEAYIRGQFGEDMTEAAYIDMVERETLSNYYQTHLYENYEFTDDELNVYYEENRDEMDLVTFTQFNFTTESLGLGVDAETGLTEEPTDEQKEAFDADKEAMGELADELVEALEDGATLEEVEKDFGSKATSISLSDVWPSLSLASQENYGTWLIDSEREAMDYTKTGSGTGYNATYTVTIFEGRERAEEVTSNIRHIYIAANEESVPTEEEWDASEILAEEMLAQWIADGESVDDFAALAMEHSADSGSAAVGGVIENVSTMSGYVSTFSDWATDPERKAGDTGIVKNTGSAVQGWHIMYFEDWAEEMWKTNATIGLTNQTLEQWQEELFEPLSSSIVYEDGFKDIEMVSLF